MAKDCALFLLVNNGAVLMENRPDLGPGGDPYWVYPGGRVEEGESFEEAARRECLEESGVNALILEPLGEPFFNPDTGWIVAPFLVLVRDGEPAARTDIQAPLDWIHPSTIAVLDNGFSARVDIAKRLLLVL